MTVTGYETTDVNGITLYAGPIPKRKKWALLMKVEGSKYTVMGYFQTKEHAEVFVQAMSIFGCEKAEADE